VSCSLESVRRRAPLIGPVLLHAPLYFLLPIHIFDTQQEAWRRPETLHVPDDPVGDEVSDFGDQLLNANSADRLT